MINATQSNTNLNALKQQFIYLRDRKKDLLNLLRAGNEEFLPKLCATMESINHFRDHLRDMTYTRNELLAKTKNCYANCFQRPLNESFNREFQNWQNHLNAHQVLLKEYIQNLPPVPLYGDLVLGFCPALSINFLLDTFRLADPKENDFIAAAKKYENGIQDDKEAAKLILYQMLFDAVPTSALTYKKGKPANQFSFVRKFQNLFLSLDGFLLKKVHVKKLENLPPGHYNLSLKSPKRLFKSKNIEDFHHRMAYVKISDRLSYLFDPNVGLIKACHGDLEAHLKKLKVYYQIQSADTEVEVAVWRLVKSPSTASKDGA